MPMPMHSKANCATDMVLKEYSGPSISAAYGHALLSLMQERGYGEADVLANTGLTLPQLSEFGANIQAWQYVVALNNAMRINGDSGLAYELGLRSQVTKHGFVGFGLISCNTLREAIEFAGRYLKTRVVLFNSELSIVGRQAVISLHETIPLGVSRPYVMDMALVGLCSLFTKILNVNPQTDGWGSEIWVSYSEPPAYFHYKDRLPRFRFNQANEQIRFSVKLLDMPIATANAMSMQLALEKCEQDLALQMTPQTMADQVKGHLLCQNGQFPDMATVAGRLGLSDRTLKRRLQEEGRTFQALLDEMRYQDSMRLLANPDMAIKQVADAMGYADPANFARAFRKWAGASPQDWRSQRRTSGLN